MPGTAAGMSEAHALSALRTVGEVRSGVGVGFQPWLLRQVTRRATAAARAELDSRRWARCPNPRLPAGSLTVRIASCRPAQS